MTAQEIFDKVANHLLTQNQKSYERGRGGLYRFNGLKCAAGCLIPDDLYTLNMEGTRVCGLSFFHENFKNEIWMIRRLQSVHDNLEPKNWKSELKFMCSEHNLKWNFE